LVFATFSSREAFATFSTREAFASGASGAAYQSIDDEGELLDEETVARARAAGLELALRDFPEDVAASAGDALSRRLGFTVPDDPLVEPWPPMQPASTL
jgi:hypothetical protein